MSEPKDENREDIQNENLPRLHRAAGISMFATSTTIGANCKLDNISHEKAPDVEAKVNGKIKNKTPIENEQQQVVDKFSKMDINDLMCFKQQMFEQSREKMIENEIRKKLEEKRAEEMEKYAKIKSNIELMRLEAERKHQAKMQAFEEKIKIELEKERQKELVYQEQRKTLAANTKKIQEEKERQLRDQIKKFDDVFSKQEAAFVKIIQSCNPEMVQSLDSFKKQLKDIKNLKDSQKGSLDGTKAACIKLDGLCQNLQREIREFDAALQARKEQKEAEDKLNAQLAAAAAAAAVEAQKSETIVPKQIVAIPPRSQEYIEQVPLGESSTQTEAYRVYNECCQLLLAKHHQTKTLDETPALQQIRFALKYAINNAINLLNEKDRKTLVDGYQKLFNLLSGQRINTTKGSISITDHNEGPDWCRLRIAEKLINRCDKEPSIVFFTAALTLALWQKFPDFGEIFKAMLYKECPFLLPFKPPKMKNQSNEEFMMSWGYKFKENGKCEDHIFYEGRTTNFAALLGALWISFPQKSENPISPFDIKQAWRYFGNVLNSHPDSNYLHILEKLLEIAGFMLHQVYGRQFVKMMIMLRDKYIPAVQASIDEETSASFKRLRDAISKFFAESKFTEPKGRVIYGYW